MKKVTLICVGVLLSISCIFGAGMQEKGMTMDVATAFAAGGPCYESMKRFKELVEENSNGEIVVNLFSDGALGAERELLESVSTGSLEASVGGNMVVSLYAPEYEFVSMPYLFVDQDHVRDVWLGEIGDEIRSAIEPYGIMIPAIQNRGPRYLTANRKIVSPKDAKGMKLRLPENEVFLAYWSEVGVNPTPIAFPEVFTSLQAGVIEGQENPYELIYTSRFHEVQDYLMKTAHIRDVYLWHFSKDWYENLNEEYKEILSDAAIKAAAHGDAVQKEMESEFEEKLKNDMVFVEPQHEKFREISLKVVNEIKDRWKPGIIDEVLELVE